jgi:hypothetical protein
VVLAGRSTKRFIERAEHQLRPVPPASRPIGASQTCP